MGNPSSGFGNMLQKFRARQSPDVVSGKPGLISQMVSEGPQLEKIARRPRRKPNKQQAQRLNPSEVPTRKFY